MAIASASFDVTDLVMPFGYNLEKSMPAVAGCNTELKKDFSLGSGSTVSRFIPGYGTVGSAAKIDDANLGYADATIGLTVGIKNVGVALNLVQQALDVDRPEDRIYRPYAMNLAKTIQGDLCTKIALNAPSYRILTSGTASYSDLSQVLANVGNTCSQGDLTGILPPRLAAQIASSGNSYFNKSSTGKTWYQGEIGEYSMCNFYQSPDISGVVAGTHALGSGTAMRIKTEVTANGATSFVLEVAGGTATLAGTIKAGEPIAVTGAKTVDNFGNATSDQFYLIVQALSTASGNEATITTQPVYFSGVRKNISLTSIPATTGATFGLTASKTYARGIVYAKPAVDFVSVETRLLAGAKGQEVETPNGIHIMAQWGNLIQDGISILRYDTLVGSAIMRDMWTTGLLVQLD